MGESDKLFFILKFITVRNDLFSAFMDHKMSRVSIIGLLTLISRLNYDAIPF